MPYEHVTAYRIESNRKIYQLIISIKFHINDIISTEVTFGQLHLMFHCLQRVYVQQQPRFYGGHGLSQQGVWVPFWTPKPLKRTPQDTQIFLCGFFLNPYLKLIIEFFHLLIIPMTLFNDTMPYFDEFIHVYG